MATIARQEQDDIVENLLIINAKKIILENQILLNGHIIIDKLQGGKIIQINEGVYNDEARDICLNCKRNEATYAPAECDECINIYCKKCAMKMATGGKCKNCKSLFASMKRTIVTGDAKRNEKNPSRSNNNLIVNNVEYLIPGFIDIHNHGLGGTKDVLDYWTRPEFSLRKLYKAGTTSIFPTITFPDPPRLKRSLNAVKVLSSLYLQNNPYGCRVEGIVSFYHKLFYVSFV